MYLQISFNDTYNNLMNNLEYNKSVFITTLEKHIKFFEIIPTSFYSKFYKNFGRKHKYELESILRAFLLQKLLNLSDRQLLDILHISIELQNFCRFSKVPDASLLTRFKQKFVSEIKEVFDALVTLTEPICHEIDSKKADYLLYDTTGIVPTVSENNPKFMATKLKNAKQAAKKNSKLDPYKYVYSTLPEVSKANEEIKQQYINGHFCYAIKAGIITNGLGIIRDISVFDNEFKAKHPEVKVPKTDNPNLDKEVGDSISLKPVLSDFFNAHPEFRFSTFLGDSAFDSYDNYTMLKNEFKFSRFCIPLNKRSSKPHENFNEYGCPVCPKDNTPFICLGKSGGKNRSMRIKYVCHKSISNKSTRINTCEDPCTNSKYGKCTYVYPDKNLRMYPGIERNSEHFDNLYKNRVTIERTINLLKENFSLSKSKSYTTATIKFDLIFAGISQLVTVLLAKSLQNLKLYKSTKTLIKKIA